MRSKQADNARISEAEMNLFEEFLNSPKDSREHRSPMTVATEHDTPMTMERSPTTEVPRGREDILAHIQREDEEVEAAIQSQIRHDITRTPEAQQATTSPSSEEHRTARPDSECNSTVGYTQLRFAPPKADRPILPVISQRKEKAQQKVANQATWVEALRAGHDPTKPSQASPRMTSWLTPEAADSATRAPVAPSSGPVFTADQLAVSRCKYTWEGDAANLDTGGRQLCQRGDARGCTC